jgi:hypothetical protein
MAGGGCGSRCGGVAAGPSGRAPRRSEDVGGAALWQGGVVGGGGHREGGEPSGSRLLWGHVMATSRWGRAFTRHDGWMAQVIPCSGGVASQAVELAEGGEEE